MIPEPKLDNLYQEVILDHNRNPRNYKEIENPSFYSHGFNPLCGDDYHLYVNTDEKGLIEDIGFQGAGCAISKSCISMMTSMVKGKSVEEAETLKNNFLEFMTAKTLDAELKDKIGRLKIFEGVREFPIRIKCATIGWQALRDALNDASTKE